MGLTKVFGFFVSDMHASARGGHLALINATASDDYRNASIIARYSKDSIDKVFTNVFLEYDVRDEGREGDINYFINFIESFKTSNKITSLGKVLVI